MSARKIKIKQEEKSVASGYLRKAEDNYIQMLSALQDNNFNAAATLAIQCAISSADAICVYEKGVRSISEDHFDVCDLIRAITLPEAQERSSQLRRVIAKKNLIQYEGRSIRQTEAEEIVQLTSRFYQWVTSCIPR